jgi:hypothetical protein
VRDRNALRLRIRPRRRSARDRSSTARQSDAAQPSAGTTREQARVISFVALTLCRRSRREPTPPRDSRCSSGAGVSGTRVDMLARRALTRGREWRSAESGDHGGGTIGPSHAAALVDEIANGLRRERLDRGRVEAAVHEPPRLVVTFVGGDRALTRVGPSSSNWMSSRLIGWVMSVIGAVEATAGAANRGRCPAGRCS